MNSLFAKILLWFGASLAIAVVGSAFISALHVTSSAGGMRAPGPRLVTFQLEVARLAYETGGRLELQAFMKRLERVYDAKGILTDENGRDVLTGMDRSDLVTRARSKLPPNPVFRLSNNMVARFADDGRYWFFLIMPSPRIGAWFLTPEHLFEIGVAVLLCYWLAFNLTRPLRELQKTMERFGEGDLGARAASAGRRDEAGQLARAFNRMAGRIETLLSAERRLLLDISHELRSPLARLGVAAELARSGENLDSALDRIQKESDRLNSLVTQLLQVTRAEGDPHSLRKNPLRLDQLVEQLVEESKIEAAARGCALRYENRATVTVEGDPELLRRAVENVIRNAIRYSPPEEAVEVSLARTDGTAVVDVRDRGPGVPEAVLPRLFDPFYRVEDDRDRASGGIGLGLSIARRAIELHKGSIRARNAQPGLEVEMQLPATG